MVASVQILASLKPTFKRVRGPLKVPEVATTIMVVELISFELVPGPSNQRIKRDFTPECWVPITHVFELDFSW